MLEKRAAEHKLSTRQELLHLILEKAEKKVFAEQLEKGIDQNMIEQTVEAFHEEQRERKALEHQRKLDLKRAWIEQAIVNEKVRDIDNLFN